MVHEFANEPLTDFSHPVQRQAMEDQAIRARGRGPFAEDGGEDESPPRKQS